MRKILLPLILLASALPGCGPGLDTDSFHPGSVDGALFWYKAEQAYSIAPSGGQTTWYWAESLGNQTGLSLTGAGAPSVLLGSLGQKLMSLSSGSYFSMGHSPLSLAEFTVYAVMQRQTGTDVGIFGILSDNIAAANCASPNLSLRGNNTTGLLDGEVRNGANSVSTSIPASTGLSVVELRYGSEGTLRLQAAGQSSSASGANLSVTIGAPKVALGAACLDASRIAKGNLSLGEVLFYNRAVSDSESLRIRRYLMLRHGVTQ